MFEKLLVLGIFRFEYYLCPVLEPYEKPFLNLPPSLFSLNIWLCPYFLRQLVGQPLWIRAEQPDVFCANMDFLHQFTLPCVLWFFSFIKPSLGHLPLARTFFFRPSSGHLYLSGQARELPIYRSVQRYQHSLEISVAQPFLFPPTHFFGLRNLYRACMLNLGYHWTGYLFYRLKKSSRHKVRTWHFTHAYRLPPIESPCPLLPARWA